MSSWNHFPLVWENAAMVLDVGDPASNLGLNLCFWTILALAIASVLPWKAFGAPRLSHWAKWSWLPVLLLALVYEAIMPARFDIRIDLLLLVPLYGVILMACAIRWIAGRCRAR